jgi:hypothetical protein
VRKDVSEISDELARKVYDRRGRNLLNAWRDMQPNKDIFKRAIKDTEHYSDSNKSQYYKGAIEKQQELEHKYFQALSDEGANAKLYDKWLKRRRNR